MNDDSARVAAAADLQRLVPGFPDDWRALEARQLRDVLNHGQLQALVLAVMQRRPDLSRAAFDQATIADVLYWMEETEHVGTHDEQPSLAQSVRGSYQTVNTRLRPVNHDDLDALYESAVEPSNTHRWRYRGVTPSPDQFQAGLFSDDVLSQFIVETRASRQQIGLVVGYSADRWAQHAYVAAQRSVRAPSGSAGLMMEGVLLLIQYLFDHFPFRKLYFEIPEFNMGLFEGVKLLRQEGLLPEHYYYADRWWSQYVLALYRGDWDEIADGFRGDWHFE